MKIKQGDAYDIHVNLVDGDGTLISVSNNAQLVEFMLGRLRKTCPGEAEEVATKEWTGEGTFVNVIGGDWDGYLAIRGAGIADVFQVGDVVNVAFADPTSFPYKNCLSKSTKVLSVSSNPVELIIVDTDEFGTSYVSFTQDITVSTTEYVMPLSQQDTFSLEGVVPFEARVKFADSQVVGTSLGAVVVEHSMSREVL